ncbi:MAG: Uncharacterised protein [Cellulomonadaceae bacterium TMED98]|nr:MAG: Uncharacterised protein [Cellulomonadaceae bacterium TMED98]
MACQLEPAHHQQLHEVSQMQTGRGRVEPAVVGDGALVQEVFQPISVGGDMDKAPPEKLVPQGLEGVVVSRSGDDPGRRLGHGV